MTDAASALAVRGDAAGPLEPRSGLARLARSALAGEGRAMLVEEAVRLVHGVLDCEVCAVFEFLPERRAAQRLAGGPPAQGPSIAAMAVPAGREPAGEMSEGLLIAPIDGPPSFGVLAVQRRSGARFDAEEILFVADVADILGIALRRLASEEQQRQAALHDPLTGLPNRALILDRLSRALGRAARRPSPVGVLFVGLDRFKLVNDTLGHGAGDELLVAVAERLAGVVRPTDTLGRLGGDEFLVVCEDVDGKADALVVAARLADVFHPPFRLRGRDVSVGASIGLALSRPGSEPAALIGEADTAMYASKHTHLHAPVLFEEGMRSATFARPPHVPLSDGPARGDLGGLVARLVGILNDVGEDDRPDGPPY